MTSCTLPCAASWLWMAGLGGAIVGIAIAAIVRDLEERRRGPP